MDMVYTVDMENNKLSVEQRQAIVEAHAGGASINSLAKQYQVARVTIRHHVLKGGAAYPATMSVIETPQPTPATIPAPPPFRAAPKTPPVVVTTAVCRIPNKHRPMLYTQCKGGCGNTAYEWEAVVNLNNQDVKIWARGMCPECTQKAADAKATRTAADYEIENPEEQS